MSQLKDLAIMMMYLYIFVSAISEKNISAIIILITLIINYSNVIYKIKSFNRKIKEQLSSQREFFISALNHDLRIPTIAQIRALELIRSDKFGILSDSQKEIIANTEDSCRCILNLISLMINTYRIDNNCYKLIYERFNLSDLIISCFNELIPQASQKKITFEYNNTNKNTNIIADKTEVRKVIMNVLTASISGSNIGEKISLILSATDNNIRLTIETENTLYKNIYINSQYSSIGQSIRMIFCKKIIETHHGKIIENNSNNNSFTFELPKNAVVS